MFGINVTEWIFILLVVLLLFGGKKIPELARSLGKGISEFKKGVREIETEIQVPDKPQAALPTTATAAKSFKYDPYTGKPREEQQTEPQQNT